MTFLLNTWYAAAHSGEVSVSPLARTLLNEPVVLYRTNDGAVAALQDRCPHRFAPLSLGKVCGVDLECGYHGLRFTRSGACAHNPHGPVPPRANVRSYPVAERYGFIWLWPGDPSRADPELLPELPYLSAPSSFSTVTGYLHVKANFLLIVDNLLDLSHALFVHPHFAIPGQSTEEQLSAITTRTTTENDVVSAWRQRIAVPPNGPTRDIFGFGEDLVDTRAHMHWHAPAIIDFDAGSCLTGSAQEDGLCMPQAHLITPETELTSHYFFAASRNLRREDPEVSAKLLAMLDLAFRQQDEPMIEAVQRRMGTTSDFDSLNPILLRTDGAPVAARRVLKRLIDAELQASKAGVD